MHMMSSMLQRGATELTGTVVLPLMERNEQELHVSVHTQLIYL